jgi:23S rRNA pseudouridine1911/1915/1917 synthase
MLHAFKLTLVHPWTREEMTFGAPLPEDMVGLLEWLRAARTA